MNFDHVEIVLQVKVQEHEHTVFNCVTWPPKQYLHINFAPEMKFTIEVELRYVIGTSQVLRLV